MKTTIEITGFPELVLEKAVELGIARSKTDALRIGILELNDKFNLVERAEDELVARKIQKIEDEIASGKRKTESLEQVFKKYPHLRHLDK
ncbi:MAG: hypothetical protein V1909_01515 [Candidatus Micrarchaeota archaeon]